MRKYYTVYRDIWKIIVYANPVTKRMELDTAETVNLQKEIIYRYDYRTHKWSTNASGEWVIGGNQPKLQSALDKLDKSDILLEVIQNALFDPYDSILERL